MFVYLNILLGPESLFMLVLLPLVLVLLLTVLASDHHASLYPAVTRKRPLLLKRRSVTHELCRQSG